jgi:hypothetical protein
MNAPNLLVVCTASFVVVFVVLALMAALMRILIRVFPEPVAKVDAPTLAAITTAYSAHYPGTRVTEVKEVK